MEVKICLFIEQINFTFLVYKIINLVAILVLGDSHLKVPINTCVGSVIFGGLLSFCNIVRLSSACYTVYT